MSRENFVESWLSEMPQRKDKTDLFPTVRYTIDELKCDDNVAIQPLSDGVYKVELTRLKYYWIESSDSEIIIGIELSVTPESLQVNMVGKNPKYAGKAPAELYDIVIQDNDKSLLMSDEIVTDAGLRVWKELLHRGHKLSVYDASQPGKTFMTVQNDTDLERVFGDDAKFRSYRFVISENNIAYVDSKMSFNTRRMRELTGIL